ncbi:putative peptidoglycan binding protein [Ornithinicoccus hortensis]|uniref:Putative peptidoglycan binding protein n=1 Tax=Ornithinicoccus hortensis TaxID=82346 RepID=A0A542YNU7_9MICO|nr:putative peptidoglycan binding protein [Ornithinicoccus hortensis]
MVSESSVGRSLPLSTTLRQPAVMVAGNGLSGVVTGVSPGAVDVGDVVYVVAGVPVRAVEGSVPFWRDLEREVEGEDVTQLQGALIELGFLEGVADGEFGAGTERAVKAWQKDLGLRETGTVPLGEVVAAPELPTVVQLGESIVVGGTVSGGEEAVLAPTGEQEFVLVVTQEQARLIPAEATVRVTWQETVWEAVIAGSSQDEFGSTEFELTGPDGGPVCGGECGTLPGDAQVTLRSEVVVVPEVSGPALPAAAVQTRADGTAYVVTEEGEVEVTVRGSGGGVAIVDGVAEGTRVQVLAEAEGGVGQQPAPAPVPGDTTGPEDSAVTSGGG